MILKEFPDKQYDVILADPPWNYYGDPNKDQAAGKHYNLLTTEEISEFPVETISKKHSILLLWTTSTKMEESIKVLKSWGFQYRGIAFVWVKTTKEGKIISGQGVRPTLVKPTTEFVIFGSKNRRGRPMRILSESVGQVITASRGKHSEKPEEVQDRIEELLGDVTKIELFARRERKDWDVWGNEV